MNLADKDTAAWIDDRTTTELRNLIITCAEALYRRRKGPRPNFVAAVKPERPYPTRILEDMLDEIAAIYAVSPRDLKGPARDQYISRPRQHFMAAAHDAGYSLPRIGRFLGGRDHTTILHGERTHKARYNSRGDAR